MTNGEVTGWGVINRQKKIDYNSLEFKSKLKS